MGFQQIFHRVASKHGVHRSISSLTSEVVSTISSCTSRTCIEIGSRNNTLLRLDSPAASAQPQVNNLITNVGFIQHQWNKTEQQIYQTSVTTLLNQILQPTLSPSPVIGWVDNAEPLVENVSIPILEFMNRNARPGKRANRGKRPVSRHRRRKKKRAFGNHRR